ncbi:MAG: sulfotransferase [Candidatus Eiseniibacteriota bacterium]
MKDFVKQRWLQMRAPRPHGPTVADVQRALAAFERVAGPSPFADDGDDPVFLLAVSWRTGSTLLQRVLMTDPSLLVWGEPWGRMALLPRLTEAVRALGEDWPPTRYLITEMTADPTQTFLAADLYPPGQDFRAGLREMLGRWLAAPARERGYRRWGFKEVRLGAAEACLLHWLYPKARFLALLRNPLHAYRSCKNWNLWYRWPESPVSSAAAFGRHWSRLAMSWKDAPPDFPVRVVKYEDVASGALDFRALEAELGLRLDEAKALGARVGARPNPAVLTRTEAAVLAEEAREGMAAWDYGA